MSRFIRKTALLADLETTYGVSAAPDGSDALLVSNMTVKAEVDKVERPHIREHFGAPEQLPGSGRINIDFDVELSGSGAAGTAPAWGKLLQACGMTETVSAASRVEYLVDTLHDLTKSITIKYHMDGLVYLALGCRGTMAFKMPLGGVPTMSFKFVGLDGGESAAADPVQTLTAWKAPVVIHDATASDITLGCTYSAGALSSGTAYPSRGLELDLGNEVKHRPLLGGEKVSIVNRNTTGKVELELSAADEVTFRAAARACSTISLGFQFGTVAGGKVLFYAPAVQRVDPSYVDVDGEALVGMDLRLLPLVANDELRIVAL